MWKGKTARWAILIIGVAFGLWHYIRWSAKRSPAIAENPAENVQAFYKRMAEMGLAREHFTLFLRAFKLEQELEVWVSAGEEKAFQLLVTYPICKNSGHLGPKRKEGDLQVPEGCYLIDRMNPNSSYHLSMGLNYPNASDLIRGDQQEPGSDIFIHGGCVTVGCLPITNPKIEELYQLVTQAQSNGQEQVPVHIFPARMRQDFTPVIRDSPHSLFWAELLPIYEYFEQNRQLPKVKIDATGAYSL